MPIEYYLQVGPDGASRGVWRIEDGEAARIDITNSIVFKASDGKTVWDDIAERTPWFGEGNPTPFHKTALGPGECYPRMARPSDHNPKDSPGSNPLRKRDASYIAMSRGQLTTLTRQLERICQTVHPIPETFSTFGHDIRNLLILACTEVEAHWRGVLIANGMEKAQYTTNDYVALRTAMRLDEYSVAFPSYPWLHSLKPFDGWGSTGRPTRDLEWYDAYNRVKHNREVEFHRATLLNAFQAVTACAIMLVAQFGRPDGLGTRSEPAAFFQLDTVPNWSPSDLYIHPFGKPTAVHYKF